MIQMKARKPFLDANCDENCQFKFNLFYDPLYNLYYVGVEMRGFPRGRYGYRRGYGPFTTVKELHQLLLEVKFNMLPTTDARIVTERFVDCKRIKMLPLFKGDKTPAGFEKNRQKAAVAIYISKKPEQLPIDHYYLAQLAGQSLLGLDHPTAQ